MHSLRARCKKGAGTSFGPSSHQPVRRSSVMSVIYAGMGTIQKSTVLLLHRRNGYCCNRWSGCCCGTQYWLSSTGTLSYRTIVAVTYRVRDLSRNHNAMQSTARLCLYHCTHCVALMVYGATVDYNTRTMYVPCSVRGGRGL